MEIDTFQLIDIGSFSGGDTEKIQPRKDIEIIEIFSRHTIWITYRKNMPPIKEKTTDAGWGCMIRSLQMALAQTFVTITLGNNWKYNEQSMESEQIIYQLKSIINLFGDSPGNLFSIHRLVAKSSARGIGEGHWWGPSFASDIAVSQINEMRIFKTRGYVAKIGQVLTSEIDQLVYEDDFFNPCIIFIPIRLGPTEPDPDFKPLMKEIFEIPQCMGMIGGQPSFAHYFHTFDGELLYYLDPHVTQQAVNMKKDWSYKSYFCKEVLHMPYSKLDPSVSFIFLIKNNDDYTSFKTYIQEKKYTKLFVLKNESDQADVNYDDFISIDSDFELSDDLSE